MQYEGSGKISAALGAARSVQGVAGRKNHAGRGGRTLSNSAEVCSFFFRLSFSCSRIASLLLFLFFWRFFWLLSGCF